MALSQIEKINLFLEEGICLDTKTIEVSGDVDEEMYKKVVKSMHILNQSPGQVTIYLNSTGGSVTQAKAIYDIIKNSTNYTEIVVIGEAVSAATIILMAGDSRVMTENTNLMLHSGSESASDMKPRDFDALQKQYRADEEFMYSVYAERLNEKKIKDKKKKLTNEDVKILLTNDFYMTSEEALKLGLISKIGHKI